MTQHYQQPAQPLLTVLNYSGGSQSEALLHMVLRGQIKIPKHFVVLNADPGMENSKTYEHVAKMKIRCEEAGILFETVDGPNLYEDILALKSTGATRFDNPPYWTKSATGKRGRLMQGCTKVYKIAPTDRWIRMYLQAVHGISLKSRRLGEEIVHKWIGFSLDEAHRVSDSTQVYVKFVYPLIEKGMTKADVEQYYKDIGEPKPPRSVCNACFANSASTYREMKRDRPQDFAQAVAVDEAIRDWSCIGIKDEVYISDLLIPVREIGDAESPLEGEEWSCDSGHCFL